MKAINTKKIIALTAGAAMVGATIFGAVAADLASYPAPFVTDGTFSGAIVVGELAKSTDVVGSIELAAGLQAAAVKKTPVIVGTGSSVIDKGVKIDKTGTHVGYGRFLSFVQDTALDDGDLPGLLATGTIDEDEGNTKNKIDYSQNINLFSDSGQVVFTQDDDDAPTAGAYLYFADNANMYNYSLDLDDNWDYDNTSATTIDDDFNTAKIMMLGKEYTITEVTRVSSTASNIDKITVLAGDTTRWMTQDEPLTREIAGGKHTFVLNDVNENEDKCGISVDGTVQWVDVGQTKEINGIQIGVTDAIVVHSAGKDTDVCEVNLGATELILENNNNVQLNGVDIDGTGVEITGDGDSLTGINIVFEPDNNVYLAAGEHYNEPVFDAFTFYFEGLTTEKTETIDVQATGNSAKLTFVNNDNKDVSVDWKKNTSDIIVLGTGSNRDDRLYLEGQACQFSNSTAANIADCEGAEFFLITSGGEAHVIEIQNFDTADNKITVKDKTYGSTSEDDFDETATTAQTVDLGSGAGAITLTVNATGRGLLNFTEISGNTNIAETSLNDVGGITLLAVSNSVTLDPGTSGASGGFGAFRVTEENDDGYGGVVVTQNLSVDTGSDDDINVNAPVATTGAFHASAVQASDVDDNHDWYVTNWSTTVWYDSEDDDFATYTYSDEYRYGQAFVGETEAKITASGGSVESVEVQQIPVGSAKLDKDIADIGAQNLIVVGGPCANTVAAALMGNPADCAAGFVEGEGTIKLYTASSGKVALLAAGYSGLDTRRVTRVLASYKDYASTLKGTEVKVKGTTLSDISVEAVV